jgi:anti-anti-sigma regulatory factor
MLETVTHWQLDVDRGPDWVFVRICPPPAFELAAESQPGELAEAIWEVLQSHHCYRVVLEMEQVSLICSLLLGQLILLSKRVHSHHGVLRISGLSEVNQEVLHTCRLDVALPNFHNRGEAVMGYRPLQPR